MPPRRRGATPPPQSLAARDLDPPRSVGGFRVAGFVALVVWTVLWAPQLFGGRVFVSGDWYLSGTRDARMANGDFEAMPGPDRGLPILRLSGTLTRAYAVTEVRAPGNDIAVLRAMAREDSFPSRVAFTAEEASAGEYPGSARCTIRWAEDEPDRIALDLSAPERAFLVIADAWFPGWSARASTAGPRESFASTSC